MPELPEVETMVRGIRPWVEGRQLEDVVRPLCRCKPIAIQPAFSELRKRVQGRVVDRVWRRAKRIVLELNSGDSFLIEPRMTGLMLVADPPDVQHLRFEWRLEGSQANLWFWDRRGLGTITLCRPEERDAIFSRLGPDALEITPDQWWARLSVARRDIKVALLDQKLVAGIGNLYASEILHLCGIHPQTRASRLTRARVQKLHEMTRLVLEEAILHEGSTLSDGTYRNVLNQDGGYQNSHRVYDREGMTCPTCASGTIQRIVQAQRSTFFCSRCQRKR
ncbi:MAG: bifunctional DNA-formamidopyrimidine glycosylase/DNA-(apurinic or apyrimidinic site) lyase [Planctomycetaceae bacterium]|nr:bifunctional DNA-formamidopyrimidine glycosylase/DNA-(apurinic or apyrimidinic site) lyase [Planctomycetaceae bacterium]